MRRKRITKDLSSEPIDREEYFLTVLRYIHENPLEAGITDDIYSYNYSSSRDYLTEKNSLVDARFAIDIIGKESLLEFFSQPSDEKCMDEATSDKRLSDKEAIKIIKKISELENTLDVQSLEREKRNLILSKLRKNGLSIRQISRLTGVSFNIVRKF